MADVCRVCLTADSPISHLSCGHFLCHDCFQRYLELQIKEAQVPIDCPLGAKNCPLKVQLDEIASTVPPATLQRYRYFSLKKSDPNICECPRCHTLQLGAEDRLPAIICGQGKLFNLEDGSTPVHGCGYEFCLHHSDAHVGRTCGDFLSSRAYDQETEALIRKMSKPCPYCGLLIERHPDTCDHVRCTQCKNDFCFKCGRAGTLNGKYTRACTSCGQDYLDHRYAVMWVVLLSMLYPFYLVVSVICFPCCLYTFKCSKALFVYMCAPLAMIFGLCGCLTQRFFDSLQNPGGEQTSPV